MLFGVAFGAVLPLPRVSPDERVLGHWPESSFLPGCGLVVTNKNLFTFSSVDNSLLLQAPLLQDAEVAGMFSSGGRSAFVLLGFPQLVEVMIATCYEVSLSKALSMDFPNVTSPWLLANSFQVFVLCVFVFLVV